MTLWDWECKNASILRYEAGLKKLWVEKNDHMQLDLDDTINDVVG